MHTNKSERALDIDVALAHVGGDQQLLAELATVFLQDYPRLCNEARQAIQQGDHSSLERAAHTLKGRLAFFGINKGREQVAALELMGRGNDLSGAVQALADVEREMKSILLEFESLTGDQLT
jgi:HPt (histidine-containing phosphotransfer) domain-containing protein